MMSLTRTGPVEVAERHFQAMDTEAQVVVLGEDAHALAEQAEARLADLGCRWSRREPDSDVSRVNQSGEEPVVVDADTFELLEMALVACDMTGGRFDPNVLGARSGTGVSLSSRDRTVRAPAGSFLDLDGLGKGRGADLVAAEMLRAGAAGALVDVGGDIRAMGEAPGGAWTVAIEHPFDGSLVATLALGDAGVASANTLGYRWDGADEDVVPILDPTTGKPARTDVVAATVVAADAAWAEVMAKAAVIAGSEDGLDLVCHFDLTGVLVLADGTVWTLPGLEDHLAG